MKDKTLDRRIKLMDDLTSIGCPKDISRLIAIEAGGSQAIVDIEYLKELSLRGELLENCKRFTQHFYSGELNLL